MPNYRNVTFNWAGGGGIYWDKTVKFSLPYILYYIRLWQSLTFGLSTFKQQICWNIGLCNSMTAFSVFHVMVHSFKAQNPLTWVPHSFWNQLLPKFSLISRLTSWIVVKDEVSRLVSLSAKFCLKLHLYIHYMFTPGFTLCKVFFWNSQQITISGPAVCSRLEQLLVLSWCTKLLKGLPCLMLLYM